MPARKKLIEVALPLEAINRESATDKVLSVGHPTTLHYWWAPRPLPACRAVVFASLVDDPSAHPDRFPTEEDQAKERARLFSLMEELITWGNRSNPDLLKQAGDEIARSVDGALPTLLDPFAGRGLIPLEGQRLGLDVVASDLNPVAVLISRCLVEIAPSFPGQAPIHPEVPRELVQSWHGASGMTEDLRRYAADVRDAVAEEIRPLFPQYRVTPELTAKRTELEGLEGDHEVAAWIWARTVRCSNPACGFVIPMTGSFWLSKKGKEKWWIEPRAEPGTRRCTFDVRHGSGPAPDPTKVPKTGGSFTCPSCKEVTGDNHLESEGEAGHIGAQLMACIVDLGRGKGKVFLPPTQEQEEAAAGAEPAWTPDFPLPDYGQALPTVKHGAKTWADLFTARQTVVLDALCRGVGTVRPRIEGDALRNGLSDDGVPFLEGGRGARAYADALGHLLGIVIGKYANRSSAFCFWHSGRETVEQPFAQQGIQKTWDFVESNPFSTSSGGWEVAVRYPAKVIAGTNRDMRPGRARQRSATEPWEKGEKFLVVTDPPYYDNMGYADLSDFFYVWLRRALGEVDPELFASLLTPKAEEIAAVRHLFQGSRDRADQHFVDSFGRAFANLAGLHDDRFPLPLFYAYRQKQARGEGVGSTGWETMLEGLLGAGLAVVGTWPILTESVETIKKTKSSLSTSVVVVCRKRPTTAPLATRREFLSELKAELPPAVARLQEANIAPVDLAQAAIGPGMAVFSRYSRVMESDGTAMTVGAAIITINQVLDEILAGQESDFDPDTRWALAWFAEFGMEEGPYGRAENLSTAMNTSIQGMEEAGILRFGRGKVCLHSREQLDADWDPAKDRRLTIWEVTQHLIRTLKAGGEMAAAELLARVGGGMGETARELAYRLFAISDRKKWIQEAVAYNTLVTSWPEISRLARETQTPTDEQIEAF